MTTYIALLRGINVGGNNVVSMAELRAEATTMGLSTPRTLLQSGNLLFRAEPLATEKLESALESMASARLSVGVDFIVRTEKEWGEIIDDNPYEEMAESDPSHLIVMVFKEAPAPEAMEELRRSIVGPETVHQVDRTLYVTYPDGIGPSKLTNVAIEKRLRARGTARNWNTVMKIHDAAAGME